MNICRSLTLPAFAVLILGASGCQDDSLSVPPTTYGPPDRSEVAGQYVPRDLHLFTDGAGENQLQKGGTVELSLLNNGSAEGKIILVIDGAEHQIDLDGTWSYAAGPRDVTLDVGPDTTITFSADKYTPEKVTLVAERQSVAGWMLEMVVEEP